MESSSKESDKLFDAAWNGDLETFKELLPHFKKTMPTLRNGRSQSVLYCACRNGRVPIVVELLLLKCMTKEEISKPQGPSESTPLHAAGWGDHPSIVALLLLAEADPSVRNQSSRLPEDEAGARTLAIFDRFKSGDLAHIQDYVPVDIAAKKLEKVSKIKTKVPSGIKKLKTKLTSSSSGNSPGKSSSLKQSGTLMSAPTIPPTDWFLHITGVTEPQFRRMDKKLLFRLNEHRFLELQHTSELTKTVMCGRLQIQNMGELIEANPIENSPETNATAVPIEIITREDTDTESIRYVDVAHYQAAYGCTGLSDVVFQVASNFNGIEAINDDIYPDVPSFTEQYIYDRTQGPVASISAGGAAIARVHAAFMYDSDDPAGWAQTKTHQLNFLVDLADYFPVQNGYVTLKGNEKSLPEDEKELEELYKKFQVCYHENVQVTSGHRTPQTIELVMPPKYIDQVFCAAINIHQGDSGRFNKTIPNIEIGCKFLLECAYRSTYLSAIARKKKHLFLTLIGGGAFGNNRKWIYQSILETHAKYATTNTSLEKVTLLLFRYSELEQNFLEDLEKAQIPHSLVVYNKGKEDVKVLSTLRNKT